MLGVQWCGQGILLISRLINTDRAVDQISEMKQILGWADWRCFPFLHWNNIIQGNHTCMVIARILISSPVQ